MNGFGLLIAVAALGVDVGWETGPGGQSYYTVHIEKLLLEPLREGQAIVSNVDPNDRNLTRFQILIGENARGTSGQPGPSGGDMVQHGWRPGENGGTDYLIQITPERLESLAKGSSIVGQIDPQVTDIRRLYIFSGVQQLPQQLPNAGGPPPPPKFLGAGGGLRTASGETTQPANAPSRVGAPQFGGNQSGSGQASGGQFSGGQFTGGQASTTRRANDLPATSGSGLGGPGVTGGGGTQQPGSMAGAGNQYSGGAGANQDWRTSGQANAAWSGGAQGGGGAPYGTDNRMLPVPQLPNGQIPNNQLATNQQPNMPHGYGPGQAVAQQTFAPPVQSAYGQPAAPYGGAVSPYSAPAAAAPNVEAQIAQAKAMWDLEAKAAAAEEKAAAALAAKVPTPAPSKEPEKKSAEEPWMPLIITTLMLFTSLAINVFLGWLAWSFFWRFRDAAGDATRAQSTLFPTRQAA